MTVPGANDHLEQGRANRTHAEWLLVMSPYEPTVRQWAVTAVFYSALHAMTAYLVNQGIVTKNHSARARALANLTSGVPSPVLSAYRVLEDRSRAARYDLAAFTVRDVRHLIDQHLAVVAAFTGM